MPHPLRSLTRAFPDEQWPSTPCPECGDPLATDAERPPEHRESAESKMVRDHPDWDPTWASGTFAGWLQCLACGTHVAVSGSFQVDPDVVFDETASGHYMGYYTAYTLEYATPALRLLDCHPDTPAAVRSACDAAAALVWADPSAAANRLRFATEELLTSLKVARYPKRGKRRPGLTTHERITRLEAKNPEVAEFLMAVKWIGNDGSHEGALSAEDVLTGAQLFEHALRLLYDDARDLKARVKKVNRDKGIRTASRRRVR